MELNLSTIGFICWILWIVCGSLFYMNTGDSFLVAMSMFLGWIIPLLGFIVDMWNDRR